MYWTARRILAQRLLAVAAAATALLATTALVAVAAYATAVTGEGLHRTLAGASFAESGVRIESSVGNLTQADRRVRSGIASVFGRFPAAVTTSARSGSFAAPGEENAAHPRLTVFGTTSGIERHAVLTAGAWPRDLPGQVVEVALPEAAARGLRMPVGAEVALHGRADGSSVRVRVTGVFRVARGDDYVWGGDTLITTGVQRLGYTTFGPLMVTPGAFAQRFGSGVTASWLVLPDLRNARSGELGSLAKGVRGLPVPPGGTLSTRLPGLLQGLGRALLVARSTMLIPALELLMLACYALLLVARLISEHRRTEAALLRARGASRRQLAGLAIGEGLALAAPGALIGPLVAPALLGLVSRAIGLRLSTAPSALTWAVAGVAALVCAAALAVPMLRDIGYRRERGALRGALQRSGADLAILALAGVSVWQLAHYGGPLTGAVLGIDPLLVAGPALALLAGGLITLRLVPYVSRVAERVTSRGRGFAPAVGAWQVSRRPLRYAGPALLLVMAAAVGVLSVATGVTWRHSQIEQADFQAGPDLRVTAARPPVLPGVTATSPVLRDVADLGDHDVTLLAGDARLMETMLRMPAAHRAFAGLAAGRPATPLAAIPGRPSRLAFRVRLSKASGVRGHLTVTVVDAYGVAHTLDVADLAADGRFARATADLSGLPYPLGIRGFSAVYSEAGSHRLPLTLDVAPDGPAVRAPGPWLGDLQTQEVTSGELALSGSGFLRARLPALGDPQFVTDVTATVTAQFERHTAAIPAIITAALAKTAHVGTGGHLTVSEAGVDQRVTVAGVVPALPTTSPGSPGMLVDLATLTDRALSAGGSPPAPVEWWFSGTTTAAGTPGVLDRMKLRQQLRDAPLGGGLKGALVLGFAAALAFSVIGCVVNAIVSARERFAEFAVMRALGAGPRQVFGLVTVEQALLAGLGLAGGTLVGVLVAHLVVPHTVLTERGAAPYPPVRLLLPWGLIAAMLAGIAAILAGALALLGSVVRRAGEVR